MGRTIAAVSAMVFAVALGMLIPATAAHADPAANDWASIRQCESGGNYSIDTGNGYYGAYQFDLPTWQAVGGSGLPSDASPAEQDYRALYLYRLHGFDPWICAPLAGLSDATDPSARSGTVPTMADSAYMSGGVSTYTPPDPNACKVGQGVAPLWQAQVFSPGKTYRALTCFQRQLGHLGYGLQGSGFFGAHTLVALHKFESDHGLPQTSTIDQRTWVAAWGQSGGTMKAASAPAATVKPKAAAAPKARAKPTSKETPTSTAKAHPKAKPNARTKVTAKPPAKSRMHTKVSNHRTAAPATDLWPGITPKSCHVGAAVAPAWPGDFWTEGASDGNLACWQMQMGHRGYDLHGAGYFGANTLAAAKDLQNRNGLGGTGVIGPNTWKAAWQGKTKN